jgi:hypothetical protein
MFVEAIPKRTQRNLALLAKAGVLQPFYLAGGTAAALYLGHRLSIDLDFFGPDPLAADDLTARLADLGSFRRDYVAKDTLLGEFEEVKISFFRYHYPLVAEPTIVLGARVAALEDLVAMKLEAISQRGTRRDFIDLYFICEHRMSLDEALRWHTEKYRIVETNRVHLIKSLAYFVDAEDQPMPEMLVEVDWSQVKRFFTREAKRLFDTL